MTFSFTSYITLSLGDFDMRNNESWWKKFIKVFLNNFTYRE